MLYRNVPKTGDKLSILGFGTMRLPEMDGTIDREKATALIHHAIDRGVNYVDTAWTYHNGQSETVVGEALEGEYRKKVNLATKMPRWLVTTPEDMDRFLDIQLTKLRTDHIDYYLIHSLLAGNWKQLMEMGLADFLDTAKADGRINNAGFSFHDDTETFKEIIDAYDWDFCQIQYNYLDEKHQAGTEGLRYAAERGIAVMIMEPLRGGNLVNQVPPEVSAIWDEAVEKRTPAAWGLRWVWNHPEVTVVLSGMNEFAQVDENIETASQGRAGSLTAAELEIVRRAADKIQALLKVPCTGCRYCMPCPNGVDIPGCFDMYNSAHLFGNHGLYNYNYFYSSHHRPQKNSRASRCRECGQCEDLCPQHIAIRKNLKDVADEFEGTG